MIILTSILTIIFLTLAIIHLHWAIGGTWGLNNALPAKASGERLFTPGTAMTLVVALGLLAMAFFYFINPEVGNDKNWIFKWGRLIVPSIFLLRSIGDFKYVGFFKKVKTTAFAKMDSKYYSPLCAIIAILGFMVKFAGPF